MNGAANQISNCQSNIAYSDLLSDNTLYRFKGLCKTIDKKNSICMEVSTSGIYNLGISLKTVQSLQEHGISFLLPKSCSLISTTLKAIENYGISSVHNKLSFPVDL